jgi:predicted MFS family arabinose efflux permease
MALLGSAVIAVTYGLARFVFGLFLPAMRADLGIDPATAGIIGALPFASYVAAILVAPRVSQALGVRLAAALAVGFAAVGLLAIAHAPGAVVLGLGVVTCGISTGLSSPIMADAVHVAVAPTKHGRVNAAINASTSVGVAAAPIAMAAFGPAWRPAYDAFALLAVLAMGAALVFLPRRRPAQADASSGTVSRTGPNRQQIADIVRLSLLGGVMGIVSALYWVFAPDFAVNAGGLAPGASAWIWLAVGVGGLAGVGAGDLVARHGLASSHAFAMAVLAAALTLLAADPGALSLAMVSAAVFGAAYMTLTGIYLVASTEIRADRPAAGPVVPFLAIGSGQIAGSALGGGLVEAVGYGTSFGAFAALALAASVVSLAFDAPSRGARASAPSPERLSYEA